MARERLADLDESKEDERERKLKLQEKNRRAQQAFRWRQKVSMFHNIASVSQVGLLSCALFTTSRCGRMGTAPSRAHLSWQWYAQQGSINIPLNSFVNLSLIHILTLPTKA